MKQTLQLKLSQHLALTPQLQQSIRLLQLSTLELNQEIDNFLQDNPLLEREDEPVPEAPVYSASGDALQAPAESLDGAPPEPNFGDSSPADWLGDSGGTAASRDERNDDEPSYAEIQAAVTSLRDHLGLQLAMMPLTERDRSLVRLLIEALDDDGYLAQDLDELVELLPTELEVDIDDLQIALKHLQNFDPPGIGARSASECLALQLANLPSSKTRDLALIIVRKHLDQLAARDYVRLRKAVACSEDELREAQA
ncbi:MAG: RNA polymerase factor sigma-54, partial [Rhodocyclaceae bacterium]|nr:RNA polymerase factor sigma-54 [Rhodocyclaceae bacterium]